MVVRSGAVSTTTFRSRNLFIRNWQSEPYKQQQNPAERRFQTVKRVTNNVLDRTGAPAYTWLLCLMYVCFVLNHVYNQTVNGVPITLATGQQADISPLLHFHFWQKVYYRREGSSCRFSLLLLVDSVVVVPFAKSYSSLKGGKPTPLPVIFAVAMMADSKSCMILVVVLWCCCDGDEASMLAKKGLNGVRSTKFNWL
jgi:hypothetical protein